MNGIYWEILDNSDLWETGKKKYRASLIVNNSLLNSTQYLYFSFHMRFAWELAMESF